MKRLSKMEWSRFYTLRRKYPELTQAVLAARFGISLDTAATHWYDHLTEMAVPITPPSPPTCSSQPDLVLRFPER